MLMALILMAALVPVACALDPPLPAPPKVSRLVAAAPLPEAAVPVAVAVADDDVAFTRVGSLAPHGLFCLQIGQR